jgi:hypothetical protein
MVHDLEVQVNQEIECTPHKDTCRHIIEPAEGIGVGALTNG